MPIVLDARTATDHFPGIGRYVVNLAHALTQIAPDLDLVLLRDPSAQSRLSLPNLRAADCTISPFSIQQQWIVPKQLRDMRAWLYHSPYYLMPYRTGVPAVLTCYDLIPLIYPQYFSAAQRLIYRLAHFLGLKTARAILSISEATRSDLVRHFHIDPQRIVVTPLGADAHFTPQPPNRIAEVRQRRVLPERYVLYFGSNKPHKNLVRLVQAWKLRISDSGFRNARLVIAGQWDERYDEAKQLVEQAGVKDRVVFTGPVSDADLPALYSGATLFVFPSLYEGFGLPALEAMACGTPVACSNTSSLPEVVGEAALTFDPLSVEAIAQTIHRALSDADLRADRRQKGLERAAQFTWERTAQQTLQVYETCRV